MIGRPAALLLAAAAAAVKLENSLPLRLRQQLRPAADAMRNPSPARNPLDGRKPITSNWSRPISKHRSVRICYKSLAERKVIVTRLNPVPVAVQPAELVCDWALVASPRDADIQSRPHPLAGVARGRLSDSPRLFPRRHLRNAWRMIPEPGPDEEVVVRFGRWWPTTWPKWPGTRRSGWCATRTARSIFTRPSPV